MDALPPDAPRRNIELKSRCSDLARARDAACGLGASDGGVLDQTDTYFHCPRGRLKLRETRGRRAELIAYARPDHADVRVSEYELIPIDDPGPLKRGLANTLGVRAVVAKRRELLRWHNVRIHLDAVEGLGTFVEFEAVMGPGDDDATARARVQALVEALSLRSEDRIPTSYGDLVASRGTSTR